MGPFLCAISLCKMAPKPKTKKPAATKAVAKKDAGEKKAPRKHRCPMNREIGNTGIMAHSRSKMYHKRALYKIKKGKTKVKQVRPKSFITKPIGGEKNGTKRRVRVNRLPK